jgi:hypothetical protein
MYFCSCHTFVLACQREGKWEKLQGEKEGTRDTERNGAKESEKIQVDDAQNGGTKKYSTRKMHWRHLETFGDMIAHCPAFCQVLSCFCEGSLAGYLESEGLQLFMRFRWFVQFGNQEGNFKKNIGKNCLDEVQAPHCSSQVKSTENGNALYLPWLIQSLGRERSTQKHIQQVPDECHHCQIQAERYNSRKDTTPKTYWIDMTSVYSTWYWFDMDTFG